MEERQTAINWLHLDRVHIKTQAMIEQLKCFEITGRLQALDEEKLELNNLISTKVHRQTKVVSEQEALLKQLQEISDKSKDIQSQKKAAEDQCNLLKLNKLKHGYCRDTSIAELDKISRDL